jgi:hypothetical protein
MTYKERLKLRKRLPADGSSQISKATKFTQAYVNMVLKGTRSNNQIIDKAIEIANEHQEYLKNNKQKLSNL